MRTIDQWRTNTESHGRNLSPPYRPRLHQTLPVKIQVVYLLLFKHLLESLTTLLLLEPPFLLGYRNEPIDVSSPPIEIKKLQLFAIQIRAMKSGRDYTQRCTTHLFRH